MTKHTFVLVASYVFLIAGVINVGRLIYGWQVQIGDFMVPMWIYWVMAIVYLYLSFVGFQASKRG